MITSLIIQNYALIQELQMHPDQRLNIITGETGAGKSIMLGAVGLLLGNRADTKVLLDESKKCIVEGTFQTSSDKLRQLFEQWELDFEEECVIRREISPTGKSRAFVNDTPATLPMLREMGIQLMDIHSQHDSLQLGSNAYQLEVLDAFACHHTLLNSYKECFQSYTKAKNHLHDLQQSASQNAEDLDYKQFLFEELTAAQLDDADKEALESQLQILENSEDIKQKLAQTTVLLDESELAILQQLAEIRNLLAGIAQYSEGLASARERIESASIELKDLTQEVHLLQEKVDYDPERAQQIKDQLDLLNKLETKHSVRSVQELIALRNQLDTELQTTLNLDGEIEKAKETYAVAETKLLAAGEKLRESRRLSALNFADEIEKIISRIGIENGTLDISLKPSDPGPTGLETVEILFSANKGIATQEIKEVASGGEFSRLIFAIKYLIADKTALPTIIFDEIDTGVSGEVALQMIQMMKEMSKNHQIISISHLPQFAAGGDTHYFVYKDHSSDRSVSKIKTLEGEERITEIAKMIGGENPKSSAVESAKELLQIG